MAEEYDVFDEMLLDVEDENDELNLSTGQIVGADARMTTWAIDWKAGRFGGKVDENTAVVHRTAKYMMTERGQIDVYPKIKTLDDIEVDFYGSYLFSMVGQVFPTVEDVENEIQALCELAVTELQDVQSIEVANVQLNGDKISFSFHITPNEGVTEEVSISGFGI